MRKSTIAQSSTAPAVHLIVGVFSMGILLAFAPFFVYIVAVRFVSIPVALLAAAATSLLLIARDALMSGRSVKILETGTFVLFGGLAVYAWLLHPTWSIPAVRLRIDLGLLVIVLVTLAIRRPFTLGYARESVPSDLWSSPAFLRTNDVITAVWAVAFALLAAIDLAMLYVPAITTRRAILLTILALYGAAKFTAWYPARQTRTSAV